MCPRCKRLLREYLPNITLSWSKNRIFFCPRCRLFFDRELRDITHTLSLKEQEELLRAETFAP